MKKKKFDVSKNKFSGLLKQLANWINNNPDYTCTAKYDGSLHVEVKYGGSYSVVFYYYGGYCLFRAPDKYLDIDKQLPPGWEKHMLLESPRLVYESKAIENSCNESFEEIGKKIIKSISEFERMVDDDI